MKKSIFFATMLASMIATTSCTNDITENVNNDTPVTNPEQTVKVKLRAAIPSDTYSRAALTANGTALTDLYIIDYVNGKPTQFLHQVSTATDFAEPELTLPYGTHEIRVIATRATAHTMLNNTGSSIGYGTGSIFAMDADIYPTILTFGKTSDTFTGSLTINATAGVGGSHAIALDRIAARMQFVIKDVVPSDAATLVTEMDTHYNAVKFYDFTVSNTAAHHSEINITSIQGKKDQSVMIYTLAPESAWQSDVHVAVKRSDNTSVSDFTLSAVPLHRNHTTVVSGEFFQRTNAFTFTVNDEWDENIEYNF